MGLKSWLSGGPQVLNDGAVQFTPSAPDAAPVYAERHYVMTPVGFVEDDIWHRPGGIGWNDDYVRTPGSQPFDRVFQGVQKANALADLQYSSNHPGMGPTDIPGTFGADPFYARNPMQLLQGRTQDDGANVIQKNPAYGLGLIGPGTSWVPNPTNPTATYAVPESQGLFKTILQRFGLGG